MTHETTPPVRILADELLTDLDHAEKTHLDGEVRDIAREAYRLIRQQQAELSKQAAPVAVPDGWALVQKKLTPAMIEAALAAHYGARRLRQAGGPGGVDMTVNGVNYSGTQAMKRMWAGALAAAPTPPMQQVEQLASHELLPDEIHQMAFEEGRPAENGDGYQFTAEEFDLFVDRLLARAASSAQQPVALRFPTMLRKMWSGGDVQAWLDQQGPLYAAPPAQQSQIYTCIGKGGCYEKIGAAKSAGATRTMLGDYSVIVYRDTGTGQLYFRDPGDFQRRMERINGDTAAPEQAEQREPLSIESERIILAYGTDEQRAELIASWPKSEQAEQPKCKTCGGTGFVDDGEIWCSEGGVPYENGPVKCVKDCPDCTVAAEQDAVMVPLALLGRITRPGGVDTLQAIDELRALLEDRE